MDFEEELILVPFNLIQVDIAREVIIIDVERERLRRFRRISKITEVQTLSTILKASIALRGGGTFGQVEDIVIRERGRVDFVVVIFEERLFAVPFSLARLDFARQVVACRDLGTGRIFGFGCRSFTGEVEFVRLVGRQG